MMELRCCRKNGRRSLIKTMHSIESITGIRLIGAQMTCSEQIEVDKIRFMS